METTEVKESFEILLAACLSGEPEARNHYKLLRDLLERLCRAQMQNQSLQMTDLAARISFVAAKTGLSVAEQNRLHTFRLASNAILNRELEPTHELLLRDAKTIAFLVRKLSGEEIPATLYKLLPRADATYIVAPPAKERVEKMRVCFQYADEQFLYVTPLDAVTDELLKVRYNVPQVNEEFTKTCELLWRHAQVNLLDVAADGQGILTPSFIVLEPDYLIDISSLAECFRDYGHHPANYALARLQPIENARPLLLGNIANLFLDEWINADKEPDYMECMRKAFRRYPIELAACTDLKDKEKERQFFEDCKLHFNNLRKVVTQTFHESGYDLDKADAVLEPSYICEALGLQGRLDYMQRDMSSFIEMKSGKADEFSVRNKIEPKENNRVQMLLYQAVLQYSMGIDHYKVKPYLLYTRYPLLYPARPSWAMVRRVIDLRNRIVADEYGIQLRNSPEYTAEKLKEINPDTLNERKLSGRFWEQYLCPAIERLPDKLAELTPIERDYFYTLYNFITKELYTSKSGDIAYEGRAGAAALWLATLEEKCEAGEILYDLKIVENHAADEYKAHLSLSSLVFPSVGKGRKDSVLPNFREGDAIVLYERNKPTDNVTNRMVFKGNIESIAGDEIQIRLRATQRNKAVLPAESLYAIEHDTMDTTFRTMYQGLWAYLHATKERRSLLLAGRQPEFDAAYDEAIARAEDDFTRVALKAQAAKDYFLLIGPPGTGKTSCALKKMVELFYKEEDTQILLLSYTNRAVDEICKALSSIRPEVDYIRVGSELSCDEAYRGHLIENELALCARRADVAARINRCRIFVGTVASISGKPELFRLKRFDVAIVDEATQILEPQLLGILCARDMEGRDAVGKFILIGDHKQLPAVVLQSAEQSEVHNEALRAVGLRNLKDSLFERLYRLLSTSQPVHRSFDMLRKQGRMNPAVALFPNKAFYGGRLEPVGLRHQTEQLTLAPHLTIDEYSPLMCERVAFLPSEKEPPGAPAKVNLSEAKIAARLAAKVFEQYGTTFCVARTLGIIAPYRSQIALIKKEVSLLGIPSLNDILVDTVERFQGSERDVIIYSFCVNYPYQLKLLSNLTETDGVLIDRKLNVALTRARKQMFIIGVPELLQQNPIYNSLLKLITK
ncbi:DEAD/DEAH box helicase [Bacteroides sp.]